MTAQAIQIKERPILFSGEMVKAILENRKTQTRRVLKPQPKMMGTIYQFGKQVETWAWWSKKLDGGHAHTLLESLLNLITPLCPYGEPGARLYVKEPLRADEGGLYYDADHTYLTVPDEFQDVVYEFVPPSFMPRWASRITLEITNVRVERLQDISEEDAIAEGISVEHYYCDEGTDDDPTPAHRCRSAVSKYEELWTKINGKKHPWESNPWVWVVEFKKI